MYQVYYRFDDSKGTEEFESYDESAVRFDELAPDFESAEIAYLSIIDPTGTTVKEAKK